MISQVFQGDAIAYISEKLGALHDAHLAGVVLVEAVVHCPELAHLGLGEAVALLEDQHEVEVLLELQLAGLRIPIAVVDLVQDLVEDFSQRGVSLVDEDLAQLLLGEASARVQVVPGKLLPVRGKLLPLPVGAKQGCGVRAHLLEDLLAKLPGEDQKLRESKRLRRAGALVEGGLLQALPAAQPFAHDAGERRHLQAEDLHESIAEGLRREDIDVAVRAFARHGEEVELPA
mmetsp:Transcript_103964/g.291217  ORF Transcript_103964/g.291217 Transcript_103964/m.291217 type:complete len:231 (-) Transcript_103964:1184-1876(-)